VKYKSTYGISILIAIVLVIVAVIVIITRTGEEPSDELKAMM